MFFLLALLGYLHKGAWKTDAFEHWVVLSLIVGFICQAAFMSSSFGLFDSMFDIAHLLKKVSYLCMLTGLLISLTHVLVQAERDQVALREHRDHLQERTADLETANRELSEYDRVVSHDLRAPLRAIQQYADFLREDLEETLEGDQMEYLEGLTEAVANANALVGDLLHFSQVGRERLPAERIDVGAFFKDLCDTFAFPQDVAVEMAEHWPAIDVEPVVFRMVFQNLISNAAKFNASSPKSMELGWREPDADHWEFHVRDNGIGIDPRFHEQIFRVFERLHTADEFEGTGIGLAIVRKALNHLQGSIRVESKSGQGSTFYVTLPKTRNEKSDSRCRSWTASACSRPFAKANGSATCRWSSSRHRTTMRTGFGATTWASTPTSANPWISINSPPQS